MDRSRPASSSGSSGLRRHRSGLLAVAVLALALQFPTLFGDRTYFYRDLYRQHLGTARLLGGGDEGRGLLWDPLLNGGQPLLGNPNRFVLYPTRALYWMLDGTTALNWEIGLHLLLGALGAYALAARLGRSPPACFVAAAAFALSGPSVSLTNHLGRHLAFQWLPWVVLAFDGLAARRRRVRAAWTAAATATVTLQWLTGAAEMVVVTAVTVAAWALVAHGNRGIRLRHLAAVGLAGALATGVAAVQVVPAAETVLLSVRATSESASGVLPWSMNPQRLVEIVVPGALGPVDVATPQLRYWGSGLVDLGFPYLLSIYMGASALVLASVGLLGSTTDARWSRLRWWLLGIAVLGVVGALGRHAGPVASFLFGLPLVDLMRYPVKAILLAVLPIALLASAGLDIMADSAERTGRRLLGPAVGIAVAAGGGAAILALLPGDSEAALRAFFRWTGGPVAPGVARALAVTFAVSLAILCALLLARRGSSRLARLAAASVVLADLGSAAASSTPLAPRALFANPPSLVAAMERWRGDGRLFRDRDPETLVVYLARDRAWAPADMWIQSVDAGTASIWGVPVVYNEDEGLLASRWMHELTRQVLTAPWSFRMQLLRLGGASVVVTSSTLELEGLEERASLPLGPNRDFRLYRVAEPLPPVWWVQSFREVGSAAEAAAQMLQVSFDASRQATIETVGQRDPPSRPVGLGWLQPRITLWSGTVGGSSPGLLVTRFQWHPGLVVELGGECWQASRVNGAFAGLPVPRGRHQVRVLFAPRSVLAGAVLSVLFLVALVAWVAPRVLRRERPAEDPPAG